MQNGWMTCEQWTGKGMEATGYSLFQEIILMLVWTDCGNTYKKFHNSHPLSWDFYKEWHPINRDIQYVVIFQVTCVET
jgi:hypothetical protein